MKKLIAAAAALVVIGSAVFAADVKKVFTTFGADLKSGNIIVNGGIGVDTSVFEKRGYYIPVIGVSAEYTQQCGPVPLGFGLFVNYKGYNTYSFNEGWTGNRKTYNNNNIDLGLLVNYHMNTGIKNLDVYVGPRLGVDMNVCVVNDYHHADSGKYETTVSTEFIPGFYWGAAAGASYYFTKMIGVNLEAGYPVMAKVSASFKF